MDYQILAWDTDFFGIQVAKIIPPILEQEQARGILSEMGRNGVQLAYWASAEEIAVRDAKILGCQLVDKKITLSIDLDTLKVGDFISTDMVEVWNRSMPTSDLESLAVQSGEYSRFSVDPNVPKAKFQELYKIWIRKCLEKEIADEVLVIREGESVVGMVTLGDKNGKGDIGLVAVDRKCRGRKYGEMLVRGAQTWFLRNGYKLGQVVTQGENLSACNLYRKCGYSVAKVEYFYHFWL
jgi:dTDP-4-amino-4,6-dideoxy-D-galactose acyltransferase